MMDLIEVRYTDFSVSFRHPHSEWERAPSSLVLLLTRSATFVACGVKERFQSSVTPSRTGLGLYFIGALLMMITGSWLASLVQLLKKLTSLFEAFRFSFHALH